MKRSEKILFGFGILAFVFLAWKMPWTSVGWAVRSVGLGFILIFSQEIAAHVFNTLGWWAAFLPEHRKMVPSLRRLLRLRIAGDGVHYLIPSALVAGEMAKASMIGDRHPLGTRLSSLVVSKFTQLLAFAVISVVSLALIVKGKVDFAPCAGRLGTGTALLGVMLAGLIVWELRAWRSQPAAPETKDAAPQGIRGILAILDEDTRAFLRRHPGLFALSVFFFALAYLWGAFEAYWICRFLGLPISVQTALIIEILSTSVDGLFFMVPAKAGVQEAGKTAIFTALGLPKASGFAFGLIRHAREILWSVAGWALYYRDRKSPRSKPAQRRPPAPEALCA